MISTTILEANPTHHAHVKVSSGHVREIAIAFDASSNTSVSSGLAGTSLPYKKTFWGAFCLIHLKVCRNATIFSIPIFYWSRSCVEERNAFTCLLEFIFYFIRFHFFIHSRDSSCKVYAAQSAMEPTRLDKKERMAVGRLWQCTKLTSWHHRKWRYPQTCSVSTRQCIRIWPARTLLVETTVRKRPVCT